MVIAAAETDGAEPGERGGGRRCPFVRARPITLHCLKNSSGGRKFFLPSSSSTLLAIPPTMLAFAVLALASAATLALGQATLTTPATLVQCQPALLTVSGGTPP